MGKVLLCLGQYAVNPYFMERALVNIYSIEELCYCLMHNVFLTDQDMISERLINWINDECGIKELSDKLHVLAAKNCSVSEFVGTILDYVGYGTKDAIEKTKNCLENEADLNLYEKKKIRADFLMKSQKYALALKYYNILLEELPDSEQSLAAKICHNKGVAYAGLFQFEYAADSFKQACEYEESEDSYRQYLMACRMYMDETDYVNQVAAKQENQQLTLKVETLLDDISEQFAGTEESRMLFTLKVCKEEGNQVSYYEEMDKIAGNLKEKYREIVAQ